MCSFCKWCSEEFIGLSDVFSWYSRDIFSRPKKKQKRQQCYEQVTCLCRAFLWRVQPWRAGVADKWWRDSTDSWRGLSLCLAINSRLPSLFRYNTAFTAGKESMCSLGFPDKTGVGWLLESRPVSPIMKLISHPWALGGAWNQKESQLLIHS